MEKKLISIVLVLFGLLIVSYSQVLAQTDQEIVGHTIYGNGLEKVLVMHDWMGDSENYRPMLRYLDTDKFTYAFIDVRGYGTSQYIGGPYNAEQASKDAFTLADKLDWKQFHVMGHSMTGMVVQWMALPD